MLYYLRTQYSNREREKAVGSDISSLSPTSTSNESSVSPLGSTDSLSSYVMYASPRTKGCILADHLLSYHLHPVRKYGEGR